MRRGDWAVGIGLLVGVFLLCPVVVAAQGGPIVVGQVSSGTPGGTLPVGAPVNLQFFSESAWTRIYTTTLGVDGTFHFENVPGAAGDNFVTRLAYHDVSYFSEPAILGTGAVLSATIVIFEPTADLAGVQVDQAHFFIVPLEGGVRIAEYYLLGNTGDHAFVGAIDPALGITATVGFALPPGAENLTFDGPGLDERYVGTPAYFADTRPVLPGTATIEVSFSYELAYQEDLSVARSWAVPVASSALIMSGDQVGLDGDKLTFDGFIDTQMGTAASYAAGPLAANETLVFTFVRQTEAADVPVSTLAATTPLVRNPTRELGIGIVALALSLLLSYRLWQPSGIQVMPKAVRPIVAELADLDARFATGDLSEADYRQKRGLLKRRARFTVASRERVGSDD